jgi:O-acetyl-ADP-ribose deacetylase
MTGAGDLAARAVIHTVGPVWRGGAAGEAELLASCYRESLALAATGGFDTIAFPAISTGAYGYPKAEAARAALAAIEGFLGDHAIPTEVWLVFFSESDARGFLEAVAWRNK